MATYLTTDFADFSTCSASDCGDWTCRYNDSTGWAVSGGDLSLISGKANDHSSLTWDDLDGDSTRNNIEVLMKVSLNTSDVLHYPLILRGSGADESPTAFLLYISPTANRLRVSYVAGSDTIVEVQSATVTIDPSNEYWVRFRVNSSGPTTVQAKIWLTSAGDPESGGEPAWQVNTTTSSGPTAGGWNGLHAYGSSQPTHTVKQIGFGTNGDTAPWTAASGYTMPAVVGAFTLTGNATGLTAQRKLTADAAAFTLTGVAANFLRGYSLAANVGTFTFTGNDTGLTVQRRLTADKQTYTLTGNDATLTHTQAGSYTLTADAGSFSLTGNAANLVAARKLTAEFAQYTLTGQAAGLAIGRVLTADVGTFTLTGLDVAFTAPKKLIAEFGSFALSGNSANLLYSGAQQTAQRPAGGTTAVSGARRQKLILVERVEDVEDLIEQVQEIVKTEPRKKLQTKVKKPSKTVQEAPETAVDWLSYYGNLVTSLRDRQRAESLQRQIARNAEILGKIIEMRANNARLAAEAKILAIQQEEDEFLLLLMAA